MRKFLLNALLFGLPILALLYPLDWLFSRTLAKSHSGPGELEVWSDIYNQKINADLAIYGSSRAWVHFNPEILADSLRLKVYNFGMDGHNFWTQYLRHLEYIKNNPTPGAIILSVDVFSLQKRKDLYQYEQFMPYMLNNEAIRHYTHNYAGFSNADYRTPLLRFAGKQDALKEIAAILVKGEQSAHFRKNGFRGNPEKWNKDFEVALKKQQHYRIVADSNTVALFERFIRECRQAHTNLILVYAPEYVEGQKFVLNRDSILAYYRTTAKANNLPFLDYSDDPMSGNKEYFYNASHLNAVGADLFSAKLAGDLKRLGLLRQNAVKLANSGN